MLVYLNKAYRQLLAESAQHKRVPDAEQLKQAVLRGAGLRMRPVMMTSVATIAGLAPILFGSGTGSEVMSRIAAPMVGGMVSALVMTLLVLPAAYYLARRATLQSVNRQA